MYARIRTYLSLRKWPIFFLISIVFILRISILLQTQDVGVEHDSAWYLGVARNVALRGIYATYTNVVEVDGQGVHPSIHDKITVQDESGYVYFPAGVTVGPSYIFPQALLLKIFGHGAWQYRLWPLIGYGLLLITLFELARRLGGWSAVGLLVVWLWARPDMFLIFSFEAFSEHIALLFILWSILALVKSVKNDHISLRFVWLAGMFLGLSVMTKVLAAVLGLGFIAYLLYAFHGHRSYILRSIVWYVFGFLLPIILFEAYTFVSLVPRFGIEAFWAVHYDFLLTWIRSGSGASGAGLSLTFITAKLNVMRHLGSAGVLFIFLTGYYTFVWLRHPRKSLLQNILVAAMMGNLLWFILLSTAGWLRHVWYACILLVLLVASTASQLPTHLSSIKRNTLVVLCAAIAVFSALVNPSTDIQPFLLKTSYLHLWSKWLEGTTPNKLQGFVFAPLVSLSDTQEITKALQSDELRKKKVYYVGWFLVTEVATLSDKVMYPLSRILIDAKPGVMIFGPYQKGITKITSDAYISLAEEKLCGKIHAKNDSYTLCEVTPERVYAAATETDEVTESGGAPEMTK